MISEGLGLTLLVLAAISSIAIALSM